MKTFTIFPCDWYGGLGWTFDGWAGQTPSEALHEAALNGSELVTVDDAFGSVEFINGQTGEQVPA